MGERILLPRLLSQLAEVQLSIGRRDEAADALHEADDLLEGLLYARTDRDARKPEELRKGERRISALQLQLLRTTGRAERQQLLDAIFRAEEQLAPVTTELFARSGRPVRSAFAIRDVQSV